MNRRSSQSDGQGYIRAGVNWASNNLPLCVTLTGSINSVTNSTRYITAYGKDPETLHSGMYRLKGGLVRRLRMIYVERGVCDCGMRSSVPNAPTLNNTVRSLFSFSHIRAPPRGAQSHCFHFRQTRWTSIDRFLSQLASCVRGSPNYISVSDTAYCPFCCVLRFSEITDQAQQCTTGQFQLVRTSSHFW